MTSPAYTRELNIEFSRILRKRVYTYFKNNNLDIHANSNIYFKTITGCAVYFGIYSLILSGVISQLWALYILWAALGVNHAIIGMTIMHDTVHNSYTTKKWLRALLEIPIISIGVESKIWHIEHNVIHHTYTNVDQLDQDINPRYLFRFSGNQTKRWFHKYQAFYAPFVYLLLVLEWLTIKDFLKVVKYKKEGHLKSNHADLNMHVSVFLKKTIFYFIFLVIPLSVLSYPWYITASMFITMLCVSGLIMTLIFQLAHVVTDVSFFKHYGQEERDIWYINQLLTTSNFGTQNKLLTYLTGGLNHQIEHHLFPEICHVHYPQISRIVKKTTQEYKLPYIEKNSFWAAIRSHFKHLLILGKNNQEANQKPSQL